MKYRIFFAMIFLALTMFLDFLSPNIVCANEQSSDNIITSTRTFSDFSVDTHGRMQDNSQQLQKLSNPLEGVKLVREQNGSKPIITVGYERGFGIVADPDSYNTKGYGHDLLIRLGHYAGVEFEFIEINGSVMEAVKDGLVDMGGLYSISEKRANEVVFGNHPVHISQYGLTTKSDKHYYYDDPPSIDGKVVATFEDNPGNTFLNNYLKQNNISVNYVYGDLQNFTNLDADFYLLPSIKYTNEDFYSILNLDLRYVFFFAQLGNEKLMNFIDTQLRGLFIDNASFQDELALRYRRLGNEFRNRALTRAETQLLTDKTFTVGYNVDHAPYQSAGAQAEATGMSVDYMNMLAKQYGFNVEYKGIPNQAKLEDYEDIDILISIIGPRDIIDKHYVKTASYDILDMIIAFHDRHAVNISDMEWGHGLPQDAKIGVLDYTNFKHSDFTFEFPNAQLMTYYNFADLLEDFEQEKLDAAILTNFGGNTVALSMANRAQQEAILLPLELKFYISKKIDEQYIEIFDTIINKTPEIVIEEIKVSTMAQYHPKFGSAQFIRQNIHYIIISALTLLAFIIGLIILIRQRSAITFLAKDDLTLLNSISDFTRKVDNILAKASPNEYEIIVIDIDYFKLINNYYGTESGTAVIISMADTLKEIYKDTETLIARRSAEKFLIFKKVAVGKEILDIVENHLIPNIKNIIGSGYSLHMSIGSCKNLDPNLRMIQLADYANIAHNKAKEAHKTCYEEFSEDMLKETSAILDIIYRMEHALQNDEFVVHFQPKIGLNNLEIVGAEALARWIPPIGDPIYPSLFIPVMENNGFISQLELYVFEYVCSFLQKHSQNMAMPKIAINASPVTLADAKQIKKLMLLLEKYKIKASQIEIEISESGMAEFEDTMPVIIKILRKIGFTVAMDDFGTGNSSLNRLGLLEVDVLKLDKAFLDYNVASKRGSAVVRNIIVLAKELGMTIVAEGIENKEQAKWLLSLGCNEAQGYYFAKVLEEAEFTKLLMGNKKYTL